MGRLGSTVNASEPVSIVIVAYRSDELLSRCLAAVADRAAEVVVVDNGTQGDGARRVCAAFPQVRVIERGRNDGFGTAANAGAAAVDGSWIAVLNPDAWPVGDGLERLVAFGARRPRLGAAGPQLVDERGRPQRSTIRPPLTPAALAIWAAMPGLSSGAYGLLRRGGRGCRPETLLQGEFLQGAALLVRRAAFEQVGGFDERFFMYGEDADLCARLRDAGWEVALSPEARFVHVGGGSSAADAEQMQIELLRSWLRLIAKRDGLAEAERARRWLLAAVRLAGLRPRRADARAAARWLAARGVGELLAAPGPR